MAQLVVGGIAQVEVGQNKLVGNITEVEWWKHKQEFIELANFAVDEYNKKEHKNLKFIKIINVMSQVVAGIMYYITLEAADGKMKKVYEAKVWVKPWLDFKQLEGFKPLIG